MGLSELMRMIIIFVTFCLNKKKSNFKIKKIYVCFMFHLSISLSTNLFHLYYLLLGHLVLLSSSPI